MAVATVTQWRVIPGRQQETLANIARARIIHERLGGRVRVWQATMAGPNAGVISYIIEHDDLVAYANFTQRAQTDAEWQQFWADVQSNPSATLVGNSLVVEITT